VHSPVGHWFSPVANRTAPAATLSSRSTYQPHAAEITNLDTHTQPTQHSAKALGLSARLNHGQTNRVQDNPNRPNNESDQDILDQLHAGHREAAFTLLLPRYRDRVFRLALSILRDRVGAEDAAQDVFLRLWRSLQTYNGDAALSTWIYAITRNTSISILRKRRPQISIDATDEEGPTLQLAAPEYDDSATVSVEKLLDQLPERYRRAVALFYMEDQSYEQTAAALGIPLGTVKALLHRARKRLIVLAGEQVAA
jgi:RNA polymerase sigma-70 factor, ECF subfamily